MAELFPLFVNLQGRRVVLVGAGAVAAAKLQQLRPTGAEVVVVAPDVSPQMRGAGAVVVERPFVDADLDGAWLVVAAATPSVNRAVAQAAEARGIFVNAVDDPPNATAYLGGVVRRDGLTIAISSDGQAPALTGLFREALEHLLETTDLGEWMAAALRERARWKAEHVPMAERRPMLLQALNALYATRAVEDGRSAAFGGGTGAGDAGGTGGAGSAGREDRSGAAGQVWASRSREGVSR